MEEGRRRAVERNRPRQNPCHPRRPPLFSSLRSSLRNRFRPPPPPQPKRKSTARGGRKTFCGLKTASLASLHPDPGSRIRKGKSSPVTNRNNNITVQKTSELGSSASMLDMYNKGTESMRPREEDMFALSLSALTVLLPSSRAIKSKAISPFSSDALRSVDNGKP